MLSNKPVKKHAGWYINQVNEHYSDLSPEQRVIATKVKSLCEEAVKNGVIRDKHIHNGVPLPEGYVYKFDDLLNEAHKLYHTIGI